jgi:hypothetical protein
MTEHNLFYYPCASFTNAQLPLLKVTALYFAQLTILDPVGAVGTRSARTMWPAVRYGNLRTPKFWRS